MSSWPTVQLGDILTERQEKPNPEQLAVGEIPVVAKIAFNEGKIELRRDSDTKTGMILIRPGDLVVSGINAAKGAIAVYGREKTEPIAATIHYGAYIPKTDRVDIQFLWWLLRSNAFREVLFEYVPGGIKTELKATRLLPVPIRLPSLPEQRQIVARIEELATKINEARSLRKKAAQETGLIFDSFLKSVFDGRAEINHWPSRLLPDVALVARGKFAHRPVTNPVFTVANIRSSKSGIYRVQTVTYALTRRV